MPDLTVYEDVENPQFYDHASPSYLGKTGIRIACVQAMAAVLTSPLRPKKITLVSHPEQGASGVMFFVWGWPDEVDDTIIPDGFDTYGGEGGTGLATVLGLIHSYRVPLDHAIIWDKAEWNRLTEGKLTPQTFERLLAARSYDWSFYQVMPVQRIKKGGETFLKVDVWTFPTSVPLPAGEDGQ